MRQSLATPSPRGLALGLITICGLVTGCGPSYNANVTGTVTLEGELVDRGTVAFHPAGGGPIALGIIQENGSYTVRVGAGDNPSTGAGSIPAGDYVVTVVVAQPPEAPDQPGPPKAVLRLSAKEFASVATSPLRVTVKPGENTVPLDVEAATDYEAQLETVEASQDPLADIPMDEDDLGDAMSPEGPGADETMDAADADDKPLELIDETSGSGSEADDPPGR